MSTAPKLRHMRPGMRPGSVVFSAMQHRSLDNPALNSSLSPAVSVAGAVARSCLLAWRDDYRVHQPITGPVYLQEHLLAEAAVRRSSIERAQRRPAQVEQIG